VAKLTLALLYGGISSEREVSLHSGRQVYEALDRVRYEVVRYDTKTDLGRLVKDAPGIDAALIILHGPYGEDGTVQGLLELLDIPYQGTGVLGSALAMNKLASKRLYEQADIPIPAYEAVSRKDALSGEAIRTRLGLPLVVKPVVGGSSVGISIVETVAALNRAVAAAFEHDDTVLIESYVDGLELTGGVIGNEDLEALPLIEIIPDDQHGFFDYEAKYTAGVTQEICPARIAADLTRTAQEYALRAHRTLFCRGYSRTDMILSDDRIFVIETNTIPGMTATSLLPQAAQKAGIGFGRLLDRLVELALEAHRRK
jgi:D-alanine-D-alanine ligase